MKCRICKSKIKTTFLNKIVGTFVSGKSVCNTCQKSLSLEEIKKKI